MKTLVNILILTFGLSFTNLSEAQSWDSLGSGTNGAVATLTIYKNNLIAGGYFDSVSGIPVSYIGEWNGVAWDSIPGSNGIMYSVDAIGVYDASLYMGGESNGYSYIVKWDGNIWTSLPIPPVGGTPATFALANFENKIYGGGLDYECGSWNDTIWDTLMNGVNGELFALASQDTVLYAGGLFNDAGRQTALNIASWDGKKWSNLGKGINGAVYALAVFNNKLYAGGTFDSAGGKSAKNIAVWDGSNWSSVGIGVSNSVSALTGYGSVLIAGGIFDTAGGILCNKIALWDGLTWGSLGGGIVGKDVGALYNDNGILYVGGDFSEAGTVKANNVAQWKSPLGLNKITGKAELRFFPNPSRGVFTLSFSHPELVSGSQTFVEIYNELGEKVMFETLKPVRTIHQGGQVQGDNRIDISSQPSGVYFYRVISLVGDFLGEGKIVVEK